MDQKNKPVVTHVTRVLLSLTPDMNEFSQKMLAASLTPETVRQSGDIFKARADRVAAMMEFLQGLDFSFELKKQTIIAFSTEVEAYEVKQQLKKAGFQDREFQILLDYTRGWGML